MKLHRNARGTPASRALLVDRVLRQGWTYASAAEAAGVSRRTVGKWVQRFRQGGNAALEDRSSRPGPAAHQTPAGTVALIRQLRETHGLPAWALGRALGVPRSTVSAWLLRLGLNRIAAPPPAPVQRYEWPAAGDLVHVDIKPLGRFRQPGHRAHGNRQRCSPGAGWEYVHVAIDDYTRLAYVEVLPDQRGVSCAAFLQRAIAWYRARGITCRRVLSDNGSGYVARAFRTACTALGLRHLRTRPYTPRTNGKCGALHPDAAPGVGVRRALPHVSGAPASAPSLGALLQPRAPPRQSRLSAAAHPAAESCLMNNVFDLNS